MATLLDHKRQTRTDGSVANLTEFMITAMSGTPHARRLNGAGRERYAVASVKSAIRRGGHTDTGHELVMTEEERKAWEAVNPLS